MGETNSRLIGIRILAAINGTELFGHERANIEVFKLLRSQGAELLVGVNASPENRVAEQLHKLGIPVFLLPFGAQWSIRWVRKHPTYMFTNALSVFRCSWHFYREVRRFKPTHIHIGSPLVFSFVTLALMLARTPMIYRMGDSPPTDSPFNLWIWHRAIRRTRKLVVNSNFVRRSVLAALPKVEKSNWITIIYNSPPETSVGKSDVVTDQNNSPQNLLYVGAISQHKGLIDLVEAFAMLVPDFPTLNLDIVGGSRYDNVFRTELLGTINKLGIVNKVRLHGHVADPSTFFRQALVHVAPSLWDEPAANVVVEAKRESVPSVVYPSGGLPEYVNHETDGFICTERSTFALVHAIRWMLGDASRLARMKQAARMDLDNRFGSERFSDEWVQVYLSALKPKD